MNDNKDHVDSLDRDQEKLFTGMISTRSGSYYSVLLDGKFFRCVLRGKVRNRGMIALVGDRVRISILSDEEGCIEEILPRNCVLSRQVGKGNRARQHFYCANVDTVLIVCAAQDPPIRPALIDRLLVTAMYERLSPVICLNKIDLDPEGEAVHIMGLYRDLGYDVFLTSAANGEGIKALGNRLKSFVTVFSGHSGVGKTSLLQLLVPGFSRKIRRVTKKGRGRQSTTEVYLMRFPGGGYVVDTPGFREFTVWGVAPEDLDSYYPEFLAYAKQCKYYNCLHLDEPGCVVKEAVEEGKISALRYHNYLRLIETHGNI